MYGQILGRKDRQRAWMIAADAWNSNDTAGITWQRRRKLAIADVKRKMSRPGPTGSFLTALIISLMVKFAVKLIEKWANEKLKRASYEQRKDSTQ